MPKKPKTKQLTHKQKVALVTLMVIGLIAGGYLLSAEALRYRQARDQTEIVSIRELILQAVRTLHADAPVEPQSGDMYFPPARLYIPSNASNNRLTYAYDTEAKELSVSSRNAVDQAAARLYSARNIDELFEAVPKLQSCSRGIRVLYQEINTDDEHELKHTVQLNNGRTVYLYAEETCPELNETADLLQNLRAY